MKSRGFTIIEIIVVIGIIAVLTVIAFPAINNIRAKNRDTEKVADIGTIQLALALYYSHTGSYPPDLPTLVTSKYTTQDSITSPTADPNYQYKYVPLKGKGVAGSKCTYYH